MRTPKSYIENLEQGIVTEKMLCDVLYSYNKRAKNWRDKKREYKHSYASHSYVWYNSALENEKKYYECKSELLDLLEPKCIHEEILENDYETIIQYYLFFEIGDHSFHQPIEKQDIPQYPNLDVVKIEQLMTHGQTADNLLSCQFADKVREKLLNGEAVIVKNIEELKTKSKDEKLL
jgi:hypothetical protein